MQEAKAKFSELLAKTLAEGPQIIAKRGGETAVLVPIAEWRRLQGAARSSLRELLLAAEPRFEEGLPVPPRGRLRQRAPSALA